MKASCKKLKEFVKDEKLGSKTYHRYGFHAQAKDESNHSKFFKKKLRKC